MNIPLDDELDVNLFHVHWTISIFPITSQNIPINYAQLPTLIPFPLTDGQSHIDIPIFPSLNNLSSLNPHDT